MTNFTFCFFKQTSKQDFFFFLNNLILAISYQEKERNEMFQNVRKQTGMIKVNKSINKFDQFSVKQHFSD